MKPSTVCTRVSSFFRSPHAVRLASCAMGAMLIGINPSAVAHAQGPSIPCDFPVYGTGIESLLLSGTADLDGDGDLDLTVANMGESSFSVLLNNGDGTFAGHIPYEVGTNPVDTVATDLDGDGDLDVAVTNGGGGGGNTISVLLNNGDGTLAAHVQYETGFWPAGIVAADLDADGDFDLAIANISSDAVSVLLNSGDGTFAGQTLYGLGGSGPHLIVVADLDADGDIDLATANAFTNNVSVLLNNGDATFGAPTQHDAGSYPTYIVAADLDTDGDIDLATANPNSDNVSVLINTGGGTFAAQVLYGVGSVPYGIAAADFDSDGDLDLATAIAASVEISVLLNHGDGTFPAEVRFCMDQGPVGLTASDLNADGSVDLAVTNFQSQGNVTVILVVSAVLGGAACNCHAPVAHAGPDQAVDEGALVTLDGSLSDDPDNDPLTYTWTQLAGPTVVLGVTDSAHPTFVAPIVPFGGSTLTFKLIVNDGAADSAADTVDITVKNVNHPPVADAGLDQMVAEASPVTLNGAGSYDEDVDPLTYAWVQVAGTQVTLDLTDPMRPTFTAPSVGFGGATLMFELTVDDGQSSDTDTVDVVVEWVNHPPDADAGPDQTRNEGAMVTLNGAGSGDPDNDPLTYAWQKLSGPPVTLSGAASATPSFTAPQVGAGGATLVFRVTVSDGYGGTDSDEVSITVHDTNSPPNCSLAQPSLAQLWPPNHKMKEVSILGVTDPENSQVTITILGVTQDEPLNAQGNGDGNTTPDAVILPGNHLLLRAERAGGGNGRVYRITFQADDGAGGVCTGTVTVCVPHDQGQGCNCMEDAVYVDSTGP